MFENRFSMAVPDIDRTDFLLIIGANPMVSNGSLVTAAGWPRRLKALQQRGGTVVVVDPHRTRTAVAADQHVAIRPGRDHRNAGESALADRPDSRSAAGLLVVLTSNYRCFQCSPRTARCKPVGRSLVERNGRVHRAPLMRAATRSTSFTSQWRIAI
jgi:hypothetical protein